MISSISSSRIWTPQPASATFQGNSGQSGGNTSSGSPISALAGLLFTDTSDDGDDYGYSADLSSTIGSVQHPASGTAQAIDDGAVDDISSNAFMKALGQKIDTLKDSPDTQAMAQTMQDAVATGRLVVTDVVTGQQVKARSGTGDTSGEVTAVATSEWSSFLRDTLLRDSYGRYVRNADSSHIDKATGDSAYFGLVGDNHYYLTWTAATNA